MLLFSLALHWVGVSRFKSSPSFVVYHLGMGQFVLSKDKMSYKNELSESDRIPVTLKVYYFSLEFNKRLPIGEPCFVFHIAYKFIVLDI